MKYYNKQGKEIELMEWATLFDNFEDRIVAKSEFPEISTVWLGTNEYDDEPPLIFGTLLPDGDEIRHATWDEAAAYHKQALKDWA